MENAHAPAHTHTHARIAVIAVIAVIALIALIAVEGFSCGQVPKIQIEERTIKVPKASEESGNDLDLDKKQGAK